MTSRVRFGPFEADVNSGELRRDGVLVPLQDLPFRLLVALLEKPGELITRTELIERLWGPVTVDTTAGLNTAVAKLRDALGDAVDRPAYIETVPKRGYRFIGVLGPRPGATNSTQRSDAVGRVRASSRVVLIVTAAAAICVVIAAAAFQLRAVRSTTRVAVVLFDNETGRPEYGRLAQGLTDATVFELTGRPRLAVIGNAAVLRSGRPFRNIAVIRDAVQADFIVIGQVQTVDNQVRVRTHLIRAKDEAHVWVGETRMTSSEAALESEMSRRVADATQAALRAVKTTPGS